MPSHSLLKKELRNFGLIVGGIIFLLGIYYFFQKDISWTIILILMGCILIIGGLFLPYLLFYPYRVWMFMGKKIGWLVNKIVLALFFFLILTPFALCRRFFNKDPIALKWQLALGSYYEDKKISVEQTLERKF